MSYDGWDNLRLCSVCGDRETTTDVCWACRQQEMIDNDVYEPTICPKCHSIIVEFVWRNDGEDWQCHNCTHKWRVEVKK